MLTKNASPTTAVYGGNGPGAGPVVILVDNKVRDLDVASLIAHQLHALGIECHLEPLEAFRAVLTAYRPEMIIFNHLTASHLVEWSKRLAEIGVLTAVLPNEGILYDPDVLHYNAGRHHNGAHIDYFFCWNEPHRQALLANGFAGRTAVEAIGVPRFDFYFEPWSRMIRSETPKKTRPRVLFCTNFTTAKYNQLPRVHGDRFFAPWAERIALYRDYWPAIEAHGRSRVRALDYLTALADTNKYDIVLRPHPSEDALFYTKWLSEKAEHLGGSVRIDSGSNIASLILNCDIEISCETCTTAMESWIAGKPTIELIFERNPLWYRAIQAQANVECDEPAKLPGLVEQVLAAPAQADKLAMREDHLATWCLSPDGTASRRLAGLIAAAVRGKKPADWSQLTATDYRRGIKLQATRRFGLPYHFNPFLPVKHLLFGDRYAMRDYAYRKAIKPRDVRHASERIRRALAGEKSA